MLLATSQCDQMVKLWFQYLAIYAVIRPLLVFQGRLIVEISIGCQFESQHRILEG